jgi:hypothetical protein
MRKRIFIGTLIVAVAASVLFWQLAGRASSPHMERYLPADTLAFVEAANLSEQTLRLVETKAWKVFSEANPELATGFLMSTNYSGLLRANVAAALIRLQVNAEETRPLAVVLAESDDDNFQQNIDLFFAKQFEQAPPAVSDYRGVSLMSYGQGPHRHLSYARMDDLFIFSDREDGLKEVIDVLRGGAASLADNPRLTEMRQRLGYTDGFFGFADGEQALRAVHALQQSRRSCAADEALEVERVLRAFGLDSVTAIGGVSSFEAEGVVERLRIETRDGGTGVIRAMLNSSASPRQILSLIPATAHHVFVASTGDAVAIYDEVYRAMLQVAGPEEKANIEKELAELGVSLRDDLLATAGQEVAIITLPSSDSKRSGIALVVEVRDLARLKQSLERIADSHQLSIVESTYADSPVMTIESKKADDSLHVAFVDDFLAISDTASVIEAVIDAHRSGNTMATSSEYQQAFAGRVSAPRFTFYQTSEDVLKLMIRALGHSKNAGAIALADGEKLFPTALYSVAEGNGLYVESYSPLGTFPYLLTGLVAELSKVGQDK